MMRAVTADFARLPGAKIVTMRDVRLPPIAEPSQPLAAEVPIASPEQELDELARLAAAADWTLLIAPETDGALLERSRLVLASGGRLLSPPPAVVEIAADKQRTAELLGRAGVPVPRGAVWHAGQPLPGGLDFPVVIKPIDGCGSQSVRKVSSSAELSASFEGGPWRCEEYVGGLSASVAILCGPVSNVALPACRQRFDFNRPFDYLGGGLPLPNGLDRRARRLALAALGALPQPFGYLGMDLVLGSNTDGSGDRVIEINPRLTTSYVGLRVASETNLAAAMLAVARGESPDLRFREGPVEFIADGTILIP
jgi:predicted ATP-grasp superfamily ATP-dependent carboligase